MPESEKDAEVRALLLALGYDEKVVGDMVQHVVWSTRAINDMKYSLARKKELRDAKETNPDDHNPKRRRRRKADRPL